MRSEDTNITKLTGTGPGGRIWKEDIQRQMETSEGETIPSVEEAQTARQSEEYQGRKTRAIMPLAGMRRMIAERMHQSLSVSAQVTEMGEVDMSEMVKVRQRLVDQEELLGTRVTYTDLSVLATARVLSEYPMVNASIVGNKIRIWEDINIGIAVAVEDGLIVPVVKSADRKSLPEISRTVKTLAKKARERTLQLEDVTGGTFTISNLGALGSGWRFVTKIINQPESAILGTGGITDRPVVRNGQIVIRPIMTFSFTYDHRLVDGAMAIQFTKRLLALMENPGPLSA